MARQPRTFKYTCPKCGLEQSVQCRRCKTTYVFDPTRVPGEKLLAKKCYFGERQWERIVARAKVIPGVHGPNEFLRLAAEEILALPPNMLISS